MVARGRDRLVAESVALLAGDGPEGALDDAFAPVVSHGAGQDLDDVLEPGLRHLHRVAQLGELPGVLAQADLREPLLELLVRGVRIRAEGQSGLLAHLVDHGLHLGVDPRHDPQVHRTGVLGQRVTQRVDVGATQPRGGLRLGQ